MLLLGGGAGRYDQADANGWSRATSRGVRKREAKEGKKGVCQRCWRSERGLHGDYYLEVGLVAGTRGVR
jgi:hypothetical protein